MRMLFFLLLLLHAFVHMLGFLRAFGFLEIRGLRMSISKPWGAVWLAASLCFLLTAVLFLLGESYWWVFGGMAVLCFQVLIFAFWRDARWGSIPNLLIALVCLAGGGIFFFGRHTAELSDSLVRAPGAVAMPKIVEQDLQRLPPIVSLWVDRSGVVGHVPAQRIWVQQRLQLRLEPAQSTWYPARAEQYYTIYPPSFVWQADVRTFPLVHVMARDVFAQGRGRMQVAIWGLLPLADVQGSRQVDQAALQRFLGEMVWYPSAALSPLVRWEQIDSLQARATLRVGQTEASGVFTFSEQGDVRRFSALRYRGQETVPRQWVVDVTEYGMFDGRRIPLRCSVTWMLDHGPWLWARIEVTDIVWDRDHLVETE